jgi:hypothetical protein
MINELVVGTIATLILALLTAAIRNRQFLGIAVNCYLYSRNKKIRVSIAAILSVRQGDHFILIRNRHRPEMFGPIGGVYKFYSSAIKQLEDSGFQPQIRDDDTKNDLRGYLIGKNLPRFLRWFFSGKNREIEPLSREIAEEMLEIGLVMDSDSIMNLQYDLHKTIIEGLDNVTGADYLQLRYFGVYSLYTDHPKCDALIEKLFKEVGTNPNIISVTANEIKRGRALSGEIIGGHSGYLIGDTKTGESPPFYSR